MPIILINLAARIVGERFAKAAAWAAIIAVAIVGLLIAKTMYDRSVIAENSAKVERKAVKADSVAAEKRVADTATIETAKGKRDAEIAKAVDDTPSDASIRANCERLRRDGRTHPACARLGGGS